jgi:hypothetical protein
MTSFEFFTVLLSFVVSLGVAGLLQSVVRLVQEAPRVKFSLTWALWATAIFSLQIIYWLKSWTYHEHFTLRIETSIPPLVLAIVAFMACGLATPHVPATGVVDLREFHERQGRKYQISYAIFMLVAVAQGVLMRDVADPLANSAFVMDAIAQAIVAVVCIICAIFPRQRWLQAGAPAVLLVSIVTYYGRLMEQ